MYRAVRMRWPVLSDGEDELLRALLGWLVDTFAPASAKTTL
ncbi:hypothetical protein OG390_04805 [Streptomyces sp. NBC_00996]|nr:hypothetical protein OG390_04805 [Streptomyces sp. NBC_00996]